MTNIPYIDRILVWPHTVDKIPFAANDCDEVILLDLFCQSAVAELSPVWYDWAISWTNVDLSFDL